MVIPPKKYGGSLTVGVDFPWNKPSSYFVPPWLRKAPYIYICMYIHTIKYMYHWKAPYHEVAQMLPIPPKKMLPGCRGPPRRRRSSDLKKASLWIVGGARRERTKRPWSVQPGTMGKTKENTWSNHVSACLTSEKWRFRREKHALLAWSKHASHVSPTNMIEAIKNGKYIGSRK